MELFEIYHLLLLRDPGVARFVFIWKNTSLWCKNTMPRRIHINLSWAHGINRRTTENMNSSSWITQTFGFSIFQNFESHFWVLESKTCHTHTVSEIGFNHQLASQTDLQKINHFEKINKNRKNVLSGKSKIETCGITLSTTKGPRILIALPGSTQFSSWVRTGWSFLPCSDLNGSFGGDFYP